MSKKIRIATWNVAYPAEKGWKRNPIIQEQIDQISAHIWILTETNRVIKPQNAAYHKATEKDKRHAEGQTRTIIWSCYPITQSDAKTRYPNTAVCAEIATPFSNILVYGTIITWYGRKKPSEKDEHFKAIEWNAQDWADLHPDCVAGDFNETLSGPIEYGTKEGRKLLLEALERNNLTSITAQMDTYCINHICLNKEWAERICDRGFWVAPTPLNSKNPVSDHKGFWVDLNFDT